MGQEQNDILLFREVFSVIQQNSEIFTELRGILETIKDTVTHLPSVNEFKHLQDDLVRLETEINKLIASDIKNSELPTQIQKTVTEMTAVNSNILRMLTELINMEPTKKISLNDIVEIKRDLKELSTWSKVKIPIISGVISILIFTVGFFTTVYNLSRDFKNNLDTVIKPIVVKIDKENIDFEDLKRQFLQHVTK